MATKGIVPHIALNQFKRLTRESRDPPGTGAKPRSGWGVAYYPGGHLRAVREFGDASNSVRYDEISHMAASNPDARVLLAQLWASPSKALLDRGDKLAPFAGKDGAGREWLLAFDGQAGKDRKTGEPFAPDPLRQMCSEKVFSAILQNLKGGPAGHDKVRDAVKTALEGVAAAFEYDHLNVALSDGSTVYLARYAEKEAEWNGLHIARTPRAVVACSEPLKVESWRWEPMPNRTLAVFDSSLDIARESI